MFGEILSISVFIELVPILQIPSVDYVRMVIFHLIRYRSGITILSLH